MRLTKSANVSLALALLRVALGEALDHLGHALRRHGADGQAVRAAVVRPLAADDQLEVRHAAPADVAADAEEADVGDVVLAARVEAAAGLDVQVLRVRVLVDARLAQLLAAARPASAARRRDAELARVGARAGGDVADRAGARRGQVDRLRAPRRRRAGPPRSPSGAACSARRWCASCRRCTCGRRRPARAPARDVRSPSGSVIDRHRRSRPGAAATTLVARQRLEARRDAGRRGSGAGGAERLLVGARAGRRGTPSSADRARSLARSSSTRRFELLDAQLLDHELEAGARAVRLLAEAREHAAHRLRDRQQLFLGQELVEQLRVLRHRAEPAADVPARSRARLAVDLARARDGAEVVEVRQAARVVACSPRTRS